MLEERKMAGKDIKREENSKKSKRLYFNISCNNYYRNYICNTIQT